MKLKLDTIRNAITSRAGNQLLAVQGKSPAILFGLGVVGVVTATVMACRSTLKLDDVLTEHQEALAKLNFLDENVEGYSSEEHSQNKLRLIIRTSGRIAKLYAPGLAVGVLSIWALTGSHIILSRRNASLTAAYALLNKGFRDYRARVVDELGTDKDDEYRFGYKEREIVEETSTGPVVKTVRTFGEPSVYAKVFDETCSPWEKDAESNRYFLNCQQTFANHRLQSRGHLFLNEVYKTLGIPETRAGQSVGWALGHGDDYVSFGIFEALDSQRTRMFINGNEKAILLDFNVYGPILNVLKEEI